MPCDDPAPRPEDSPPHLQHRNRHRLRTPATHSAPETYDPVCRAHEPSTSTGLSTGAMEERKDDAEWIAPPHPQPTICSPACRRRWPVPPRHICLERPRCACGAAAGGARFSHRQHARRVERTLMKRSPGVHSLPAARDDHEADASPPAPSSWAASCWTDPGESPPLVPGSVRVLGSPVRGSCSRGVGLRASPRRGASWHPRT